MKDDIKNNRPKKYFYMALSGTIVTALCCFTPILVILFAVVGLSAFTPFLDYVLFPALGIFIVLTIISYRYWKKAQGQAINQ